MPIILIEGTPGSGKTTTTRKLQEYLTSINKNSHYYLEFDENHPIGPAYNKETAPEVILNTRAHLYPFHFWKSLSVNSEDYLIIDAKFLQMTGFFCMLGGGDENEIIGIPRKILKNLNKDIVTKLIFFSQSNPEEHILDIIKTRKKSNEEWFPWVLDMFSKFPWVQERNLKGDDMYIQAVVAWSEIQKEIVANLEITKLQIEDPFLDWNKSLEKVFSWV